LTTYTTSVNKNLAGQFFNGLMTFWRRRWLLRYFLHRQVTRTYKRSYLGFAWAILSPLIWVFFLTLIFSELIGIRFREVTGDSALNFGLFLYCGLLPFMVFAQAMNKGAVVIRSNSNLVQGVVFPMEILPMTTIVTSLIQSLFGVGALMLMLGVLEGRLPHLTVLLLPLVMVPQLVFTLGLCYLVATVTTYVPDIRETFRAFVRAMFFITPILWPTGRVPEEWSFLVDYNPLAYLVESYRRLILEGELPGLEGTIYFSLFALALFVVGFALYNRFKHNFADLL